MEKVTLNSTQTNRFGGTPLETTSIFGPLTDLIGTWVGTKGWNLVAVPNQNGGFTLIVAPYTETLTITPLSTPTPNRGEKIIQQVPTLMYHLSIHDSQTGSLMHAENGTWLLVPNCPSDFSIARLASIPHGDSLLALGTTSVTEGPPVIPEIDTLPISGPATPDGYTEVYIEPGPPGFYKRNPNIVLIEDIKGQEIISTTNLFVSTANQGGINNIPFVTQNANTTKFEANFWIETVVNPQTGATYLQLQYSQTTILEFLPQFGNPGQLIQWPHVNINTLVKQ